jgi:hypothetical protein
MVVAAATTCRDRPPLVRVTPPSPATNATANLDPAHEARQQIRIFRTMPLAARWGKDTAYCRASHLATWPHADIRSYVRRTDEQKLSPNASSL